MMPDDMISKNGSKWKVQGTAVTLRAEIVILISKNADMVEPVDLGTKYSQANSVT